MRFASSVSAAATLARIMKSSISRCASSRSRKATESTLPSSERMIRRSGRSRFSGWRRSRALWAADQAAHSGRMTLSSSGAVTASGWPSAAACAWA